MRILHYIPSIDETSGGVGAYMQLLTRDLSALCELHVVTHRSENERKLEGCIVHYIANKWLPWNSCKAEFVQLLKDAVSQQGACEERNKLPDRGGGCVEG